MLMRGLVPMRRLGEHRRQVVAGCCLVVLLAAGCHREPPVAARVPTVAEVSQETVLANYAPPLLRVLPDHPAERPGPRYVVIATEHRELTATWRPLAALDRVPPPDYRARAGELAWLGGRVVQGAVREGRAELLYYDRDGKAAEHVPLATPAPCSAEVPLLQADGERLNGVLPCPAQGRVYLFSADGRGALSRTVAVPALDGVELWERDTEADYLLQGRKLVRVATDGAQTIGTVPPPGVGAEGRALVIHSDDLLIIEGAVGRVIRMERRVLRWRGEGRFAVGKGVARLRAVVTGTRLLIVTAERAAQGTALYATSVPLGAGSAGARLVLGAGPAQSDHELVPFVAGPDGEAGALLVRTHAGNTGPVIGLSRLRL